MITALQTRTDHCEDPPDRFSKRNSITRLIYTGRPGRPKFEIHPVFLREALYVRGCVKTASVLGCSSKTVRRRAEDAGLRERGPPMFSFVEVEGRMQRILTTTTPPMSLLTNPELDEEVSDILEVRDHLGRSFCSLSPSLTVLSAVSIFWLPNDQGLPHGSRSPRA